MDELLVEFSGELSGHIHVAWFPPSPLLTIQQLHSEKENITSIILTMVKNGKFSKAIYVLVICYQGQIYENK